MKRCMNCRNFVSDNNHDYCYECFLELKENEVYEWDIKLDNGLNITENKLFESLKKIGLEPEVQYQISHMTVDFAFPEDNLVIEVNGPYHNNPEQKIRDIKRWYVLNKEGWKVKYFYANSVYKHSDLIAKRIAEILDYETEGDFMDNKYEEIKLCNREDFIEPTDVKNSITQKESIIKKIINWIKK